MAPVGRGAARDDEGWVPRMSYEVLSAEKDDLDQLLKAKEKRLLRLQEVRARRKMTAYISLTPPPPPPGLPEQVGRV